MSSPEFTHERQEGLRERYTMNVMGRWKTLLPLAALVAVLGLGGSAGLAAETATSKTAKPVAKEAKNDKPAQFGADVPLEAMLSTPLPESEKDMYNRILSELKSQDREFLKGRKPFQLTARFAASAALDKNLDIQIAAHENALREAIKMEQKAAFLPVFDVGIQENYQASYQRQRGSLVFKGFIPPRPPVVIPPPSKIIGIVFADFRAPGKYPDFLKANRSLSNGQQHSGQFVASITQLLPWGAQVNLTTTTIYKTTFSARGHSYEAPWTTSLNGTLTVPFPFTKDFGPEAPQDVAVRLAKIDAERSMWDLKAEVNSTLLFTDVFYWNLVGALKNLDVTIKNRESVEKLLKFMNDQLAQGQATAYGKDQVEAEVLRVKDLEEQAWNAYLEASDALVELLNIDKTSVLVPYAYSQLVDQHLNEGAGDPLKLALQTRAELKSEKLAVRSTEVTVKFARHQLRPDLTYNQTISLNQTNSEIGFRTFYQSLKNVFVPDAETMSFGLNYRYPLFNRAFHAKYHEALSLRDAEQFTLRITENQVTEEVNDALAAVESAQGRLKASTERMEASRKAYELALEQKNRGRLTEFEVISKSQEWLNADTAHVLAQVSLKVAESQLLFSQGLLPDLYPMMTAQNEFDKYRLRVLKASQALQFFNNAPDAGKKGAK
ncbi:MAG: TolC family protein [Planctomycetes bacterium]|nr:TolC family protein [Planctomycetota bacterium]